MCAEGLSRMLFPMPTTTSKEPRDARPLEPRSPHSGGRGATKRFAAMLNPARPFVVALRERNLRRLFAGLVVSQAGDWLYNLALIAFVYERTGSSAWVGITTAARILPEVVLGPIGGMLADRHGPRTVMIASDVLRAGSMAALAVLALAGGPIVLAPLLAALCTAAGAAYPQCAVAVMPRLVHEADLPAANAARIGITGLCIVAGPLIGAALLLLGSAAATFAVNGVSFLFGAVIVASLPRAAMTGPAGAADEPHASLRADVATGRPGRRGGPRGRGRRAARLAARRRRHRLAGAARAPGRAPDRRRRLRVERGLRRPHRPLRPAGSAARPRRRRLRLPAVRLRRRRRAGRRRGRPRRGLGPAPRDTARRRRRRRARAAPLRGHRVCRRRARPRGRGRRCHPDHRGRRRHDAPALARPRRLRSRLRARGARVRRRDRRRRAAGCALRGADRPRRHADPDQRARARLRRVHPPARLAASARTQ